MSALNRWDDEESSSPDPSGELRATLAEHLEELRQRVFRIVFAGLVTTTAGWFLAEHAFNTFKTMFMSSVPKGVTVDLAFRDVTVPFFFYLKLAFFIGLLVLLPYGVTQIWGFIKPGLRPQERKPLSYIVPISILLFALGAFLAWTILPVTYAWFFSFVFYFDGVQIIQDPEGVIFLPVNLMLAFGLGFQLPLIVYAVTWMGIVEPRTLLQYWRHGIVGITLASALITPTGDIPTMLVMAGPLVILYFGTIFAAQWSRGRKKGESELDRLD